MARIIGTTGSAPPAKRVKVKAHTRAAPAPKPTAPPQTPDSRDNNRAARPRKPRLVVHPSPDAQDVTARNKVVRVPTAPGGPVYKVKQRAVDQEVASEVQRQARADVQARKARAKAGHGPGLALAVVHLPSAYVKALQHPEFGGMGVVSGAAGVVKRSAKDAAEMAVTTPTSIVHTGGEAVRAGKDLVTGHPGKAAREAGHIGSELAKPYEDLAKHPIQSLSAHPLRTALMVAPAVRMPGRAVGKVARVAGKQTLERPPAVLPNTALKEAPAGSRDAVARAVQSVRDKRTPTRKVTIRQVQRRVDEAFGSQQKHGERIISANVRKARAQAKALPKVQRQAHIEAGQRIGRDEAKDQAHKAYVREFGAVHQVTPQGHVVVPKNAAAGALHDTRDEAQKVADRLNRTPMTLKMGGFTQAEKALPLARQQRPVTFVVHAAGDKYGVIPDFVAKRIGKQEGVGSGRAPGSKMLRMTRGMFTRAVLPYRLTWLTGQAVEGALRAAVAGAGPTSFLRGHKFVSELERRNPGEGKALLDRAVPGGRVGRTMAEFADLHNQGRTFAGEFPDNPIAHALTSLGRSPGIKQVRQLHHAVTSAVFQHLNARFLEGIPQTAMLGKALKNSPLMERSIIGLSNRAIRDAANNVQGAESYVQLARATQRMYGKYANYGPGLREAIVHWTPFVPWMLNSGRFLLSVLPKDHPVTTALIADLDALDSDWRKQHDLSLRQPNHVPFFMMGGYPKKDGSLLEVAHYTPFGAAQDPTGDVGGALLPQFSGTYGAIQYGVDWKGNELKHPDGSKYTAAQKWVYGLTQLGEALIPGLQQTANIAGAKDKGKAVKKELRVMASIAPKKTASSGTGVTIKPVTIKPIKIKPIKVKIP